jgi:hypothetical protein
MLNRRRILLVAGLLLVIAASRITRLRDLSLNQDEIWSVWQTFGTPADILRWTPYDWPPLYYLSLGVWRGLAGATPIILRCLSILVFLPGAAALYRALRRLGGETAGWLGMMAYAAMAQSGYLGTELRGYAFLMSLLPFAFWFTLRYFDQPNRWRALPLALSLAGMFYVSFTAAAAIVVLGLYTLLVYRRVVWRWWLPGLLSALLVLPLVLQKWQVAVVRTTATAQVFLLPLPEALASLFQGYVGGAVLLWAALGILAIALLLARRPVRRAALALILWVLVMPFVLYFTNRFLNFFSPRYAWWMMTGIALLLGLGLSRLPRPAAWGAVSLFALLAFTPFPDNYNIFGFNSPLGLNFSWLTEHIQPGDVFVADPANRCGKPEEWDYYLRAYFPNGLTFVDNPAGYRRVWFTTYNAGYTQSLLDTVSEHRVPGIFVGPPTCLTRLYEAPPDIQGILFENGMRFHGVDILDGERIWSGPVVRHEGEMVHFRLWWSVDRPTDLDYSVGAYLLYGSDKLIDQSNGSPELVYPPDAPRETSRWQPGQYYIEERTLTLPSGLASRRNYGLYLAVYFWQNNERVAAPGVDNARLLLLRKIDLVAY